MRALEGDARFDDLPRGFVRAEINRRAHRCGAHVPRLLDLREINLIKTVRHCHQFVVVQLHDERDFVRVFARHDAQHAERGSDGVAAAFDGQLHDVFRVKIIRVLREARAGGMFDALIHREDGQVARAGEAATAVKRLKAAQHLRVAVGQRKDAVHEIRSRQVKPFLRHGFALMFQESLGGIGEKFFDFNIHKGKSLIDRVFLRKFYRRKLRWWSLATAIHPVVTRELSYRKPNRNGERTRRACGFPRLRGKHRARGKVPNVPGGLTRKTLDARRVQPHPGRVRSPSAGFGIERPVNFYFGNGFSLDGVACGTGAAVSIGTGISAAGLSASPEGSATPSAGA